ncbi:hypothetical protein F5890DRAFT_1409873 [Lentinula detonsa]|uniref:Reverse transcriptase zinc-binding domain-containing protein n=1 Tax=Lentinula detonsa TaxID=2804962 RepID=A0AA38UTM0_9AGAR|nr:hypothetical protein F5890DRAFT_1409873 [Lentinula detonsa]
MDHAGTLKRKQTSIIFQLRTGHVPLKAHLYRIRKEDSPVCPHCERLGQHTQETVKHYIMECPAYRKERFHFRRRLGREARSLRYILSDGKAIPHLLRFIGETKRFQKTFGDIPAGEAREE